MKNLIVTEKPSVAKAFASVLGVKKSATDGYIENENWIITWCVGHLVTLCYPEDYDESLKRWTLEPLPFLPSDYKYQVISDVRKQFAIIKKLYNRTDISTLYYAGDPAREGLYIQMLVRQEAGHKCQNEKVVWIDSQTEEEIKKGIKNAKQLSEYQKLSDAGYMRAIEDFASGINFSRLLSVRYAPLINNAVANTKYMPISVGRVMTCVLGMVVEREREIAAFTEISFYKIADTLTTLADPVYGLWKTGIASTANPVLLYNESGFREEQDARAFINTLPVEVTIDSVLDTQEKKNAPYLFNLAELQYECSKLFKISPDETLSIAQSLYEKKLTTYPRTDARVLSSAIAKVIETNLKGLMKYSPAEGFIRTILQNQWHKNIEKSSYTDDNKVTDHYALIPTGEGFPSFSSLSEIEINVYDLIVRRFLSIFYPPAVYRKIKLTQKAGSELFYSSAKSLIKKGYLEIYSTIFEKEKNNKENQKKNTVAALATMKKGDVLSASYQIEQGKTTPPKRYTSGSMILAMENAGQLIEEADLRAMIKGSGIGTSATRDSVIKKLVRLGYLALNKKTQMLTPGKLGDMVFEVVSMTIPSLLKPKMTASWEKGLSEVENGTITAKMYRDKLEQYIRTESEKIKANDLTEDIKKRILPYAKVKEFDNKRIPNKGIYKAGAIVQASCYLEVPFDEKEEAKALGASFDGTKKSWYVPKGVDESLFAKWKTIATPKPASSKSTGTKEKKYYLDVPYEERLDAKKLGAQFDGKKKKWYYTDITKKNNFIKWTKK